MEYKGVTNSGSSLKTEKLVYHSVFSQGIGMGLCPTLLAGTLPVWKPQIWITFPLISECHVHTCVGRQLRIPFSFTAPLFFLSPLILFPSILSCLLSFTFPCLVSSFVFMWSLICVLDKYHLATPPVLGVILHA